MCRVLSHLEDTFPRFLHFPIRGLLRPRRTPRPTRRTTIQTTTTRHTGKRTNVMITRSIPMTRTLLLHVTRRTTLTRTRAITRTVMIRTKSSILIHTRVGTMTKKGRLTSMTMTLSIQSGNVMLSGTTRVLVNNINTLMKLTNLTIIVLSMTMVLTSSPTRRIIVLLLMKTFRTLRVKRVNTPNVRAKTNTMRTNLNVMSHTNQPRYVSSTTITNRRLILSLESYPTSNTTNEKESLVRKNMRRHINQETMFLIMFRVKISNRHLHFPHLLYHHIASVTTSKTRLNMNSTRRAILGVRNRIPTRTLSLSIRMKRNSNVTETRRPTRTIFLLIQSRDDINATRNNNANKRNIPFHYGNNERYRTRRRRHRRRHHAPTHGLQRPFRIPYPPTFYVLFDLTRYETTNGSLGRRGTTKRDRGLRPTTFRYFCLVLPIDNSPHTIRNKEDTCPFHHPSQRPRPKQQRSNTPPSHNT